MAKIDEFIIKLHRMGYRTRTTGNRMMVEDPGGRARIFVSNNQLENLLLLLTKAEKPARKTAKRTISTKRKRTTRKGQRPSEIKTGKKGVSSLYGQSVKWTGRGPYQGGLPGLGKHR